MIFDLKGFFKKSIEDRLGRNFRTEKEMIIRMEGIIKGKKKSMQNRQIDKKTTKQVRIDAGLHQLLKIKAAKSGMTIKALLEEYLADILAVNRQETHSIQSAVEYFINKNKEKNSQQAMDL